MRTIIIGTRGSNLAIKQTEIIQEALQKKHPSLSIEMKIIKTEGDKNMAPIPLDTVGKGWFTKEIEEELIKKHIDLAVHSLKDLPESLPSGLMIGAISKRGDLRDVLVSPSGTLLEDFPQGAIIGTDSIRRKIQIMRINPKVSVKSVRGNINTRLAKLDSGAYDGLVLAAAGLQRLGMDDRIAQFFEPNTMMPSPGQGALAVEIREDDDDMKEILNGINDTDTWYAVEAERAFAAGIGGGCKFPIGSYAENDGKKITLHGLLGSLDGSELVTDVESGKVTEASHIGHTLAKRILDQLSLEQVL